jgi:hypothetical protein
MGRHGSTNVSRKSNACLLDSHQMPVATLTSKGQLIIPKAIREYLHLQPGD